MLYQRFLDGCPLRFIGSLKHVVLAIDKHGPTSCSPRRMICFRICLGKFEAMQVAYNFASSRIRLNVCDLRFSRKVCQMWLVNCGTIILRTILNKLRAYVCSADVACQYLISLASVGSIRQANDCLFIGFIIVLSSSSSRNVVDSALQCLVGRRHDGGDDNQRKRREVVFFDKKSITLTGSIDKC